MTSALLPAPLLSALLSSSFLPLTTLRPRPPSSYSVHFLRQPDALCSSRPVWLDGHTSSQAPKR